jgi:cytochrome c peroxidase
MQEKAGNELFRSKATHCNACARDGGPGEEPLLTDFTASNLGLPPNPSLPFYRESVPDHFGFTANPAGLNLLRGVPEMSAIRLEYTQRMSRPRV